LHAIKGMAGMLSREALHQAVAQADDAWRHSRPDTGRTLTQALLPWLDEWLAEVRDCLQRYSSG
jgi:HPt (histidine-containing phosphotransfer) domain-containing protein